MQFYVPLVCNTCYAHFESSLELNEVSHVFTDPLTVCLSVRSVARTLAGWLDGWLVRSLAVCKANAAARRVRVLESTLRMSDNQITT